MNERLKRLTKNQQQVYEKIKSYIEMTGTSPTVDKLRQMLSLSSLNSVSQYLAAPEKHNLIKRRLHQRRGIELVAAGDSSHQGTVILPVIASAGCDALNVYAQHTFDEYLTVERSYIPPRKHPENLVLFRAVGESMNAAGIASGDYVLVERTASVSSGERVVAAIGEAAVIKRLRRVGATAVLAPESTDPRYQRIVMKDDARIFGRVLDVIKMSDEDDVVFETVAY